MNTFAVDTEGEAGIEEVPDAYVIGSVDGETVKDGFADLLETAANAMEDFDLTNVDLSVSVGPLQFSTSLYRDAVE